MINEACVTPVFLRSLIHRVSKMHASTSSRQGCPSRQCITGKGVDHGALALILKWKRRRGEGPENTRAIDMPQAGRVMNVNRNGTVAFLRQGLALKHWRKAMRYTVFTERMFCWWNKVCIGECAIASPAGAAPPWSNRGTKVNAIVW
jgi:hypothetical protein